MRPLIAGALSSALCCVLGFLYFTGGGIALAFGQPEAPTVWGFVFRGAATPPPQVQAGDYREAWAIDLLARLGNTQPTRETVDFVVEWTLAEDAGAGAFERFNPLNTTQTSAAVTQTINGDGVRGYATYEDGMQATLQTLSYGYYTGIVEGLQTNNPELAKQSLFASPWAESHYGYGAGWPK